MRNKEITYDVIMDGFMEFVRGESTGEIELAEPMANILKWKGKYSRILGIPETKLEDVVYYTSYVVEDPGSSEYRTGDILSEEEYLKAVKTHQGLVAVMGEKGLRILMKGFDQSSALRKLREAEQEHMAFLDSYYENRRNDGSEEEKEEEKIRKYWIELEDIRDRINYLHRYCMDPDGEMIRTIRLLPLQVRSVLRKVANTVPYLLSHYMDLYGSICMSNERLMRLKGLGAPTIIIRKESRMLQEKIDRLLAGTVPDADEECLSHPCPDAFSLSDILLDGIKML